MMVACRWKRLTSARGTAEWLQRFTARANLKQCSADDISAVLSNFLMVNALDKVPHKMTVCMLPFAPVMACQLDHALKPVMESN